MDSRVVILLHGSWSDAIIIYFVAQIVPALAISALSVGLLCSLNSPYHLPSTPRFSGTTGCSQLILFSL
jgi:hypothetical protein